MSDYTKLKDVMEEFEKYIVVKDPWMSWATFSVVIGNTFINRDPLWLMCVAPSSGGKSTFLNLLREMKSVTFVDDLTEKTLLSGFKIKGKEHSLLKIMQNGVLAISDFTSILSKNPQSAAEILGQLRLVYDGKFVKYTGSGHDSWEGKIGLIAASTPEIYTKLEAGRSMGERFIYYEMNQPTDDEVSKKISDTKISAKDLQLMTGPLAVAYVMGYKDWRNTVIAMKGEEVLDLSMTDEQRRRVREASKISVSGKATIHTSFKTGKVDQIPNKAGVGRDSKQFDTMLHTLQNMNAYETETPDAPVQDWMLDMIDKCAYSSINRERRRVLEILAGTEKMLSSSQIGADTRLSMEKESVEQYINPLHSVGLITKNVGGKGEAHKWFIRDEETRKFILRVSPMMNNDYITRKIVSDEELVEQLKDKARVDNPVDTGDNSEEMTVDQQAEFFGLNDDAF